MDITMLPPSAILSNHSHHLYHPLPLLPSAMPRRVSRYTPSSSYSPSCGVPAGFASYHHTPRSYAYEPELPADGSSPISSLPDELWLEILKFMDWKDLLPLRTINSRLADLVLSAGLHRSMTITSLPALPLPPLLTRYLLPPVKHLQLHLFPYPSVSTKSSRHVSPAKTIMALLDETPPDQLISLSVPFSAPYLSTSDLGVIISRLGGRLEKLDLKGSGLTGKGYLEWIGNVGSEGRGLRELDLGFTSITELLSIQLDRADQSRTIIESPPPPSLTELVDPGLVLETPSNRFSTLTDLSLASCTSLSPSTIYSFLSALPPSLSSLDISRLEQTSFQALWNMRVTHVSGGELVPTALQQIKVVGIDHLTRLDIRRLKHHWESQRRACPRFSGMGVRSDSAETTQARVWGEPRTPDLDPSILDPNLPSPRTPTLSVSASSPSGSSSSGGILGSSFGSASSSSSSRLQDITRSMWPQLRTPESTLSMDLAPSPHPSSYDEKINQRYIHPFLRSRPAEPLAVHDSLHGTRGERDSDEMQEDETEGADEVDVISINILHSAILESEDEAGYRQFIGEVAGGTVGLGFPIPNAR